MAEIAQKAGVSTSTVSRALREHPSIPESTRQRIRDIAEELGYQRNPYISALMASLKGRRPIPYRASLAILDCLDKPEAWTRYPAQRQFHDGIVARAREMGYGIDRNWLNPGSEGMPISRTLMARGIRGVLLIAPGDRLNRIADLLDYSNFCTVSVGFRSDDPPLHFCISDQLAAGRKAFAMLHAAGHKRIGMVTSAYLEKLLEGRLTLGFRYAAESLNVKLPASAILRIPDGGDGLSLVKAWYEKFQPDALCGVHADLDTVDEALRKTKCRPALACLDLNEQDKNAAGILQHNELVGASAVDLVVRLVERADYGLPTTPLGTLIEGEWFEATPAAKHASA